MKGLINILILTIFILTNSCFKERFSNQPQYYSDDFERYKKEETWLDPAAGYWSFSQQTLEANSVSIDSSMRFSGKQSLYFFAEKSSTEQLSKCSISKQNMSFPENGVVRISVQYYLDAPEKVNWLFLADLEEQTAIGAGPGLRLVLVNGQIRMEYKFLEKDVLQFDGKEKNFPLRQWVNLVWEIQLSQKNRGWVKVWQDGVLLIEKYKIRTMPKDLLYSQQGTKGIYSSVEIGVTANTRDAAVKLWADDFWVQYLQP